MKNTKEFTFNVVKHIGNISEKENYTKEINYLSWSDRQPNFDIRGFKVDNDGVKHALKGIILTKEEIIALRDLLNNADLEV